VSHNAFPLVPSHFLMYPDISHPKSNTNFLFSMVHFSCFLQLGGVSFLYGLLPGDCSHGLPCILLSNTFSSIRLRASEGRKHGQFISVTLSVPHTSEIPSNGHE